VLDNRQMIQAFLDKEADNAIGVEYEIRTLRVSIANHSDLPNSQLSLSRRQPYPKWISEVAYVRRAINWGVCGNMCTFS